MGSGGGVEAESEHLNDGGSDVEQFANRAGRAGARPANQTCNWLLSVGVLIRQLAFYRLQPLLQGQIVLL